MEKKKVFFISDLHLGADYMDGTHNAERRVIEWIDSVRDEMAELYLMGDILDYWYEYRYVVPRGYVRFFGKLAELSDNGVKVHWFIGNHDIWIFDYLPYELGIEVIDGSLIREIMGRRFFLAHGDGVGRHSRTFRFLRALFRNRLCQRLYAAIHPRWTVPFAHGWSSHSRRSHKDEPTIEAPDCNGMRRFVDEYSAKHPYIDYYVFGHFHIVKNITLANKAHLIILGDWISKFSYASFDGYNLEIKYFKRQSKMLND